MDKDLKRGIWCLVLAVVVAVIGLSYGCADKPEPVVVSYERSSRVMRDPLRQGPGEFYIEVDGVRRTLPSPEEQRP